jgi:hypothetical protein
MFFISPDQVFGIESREEESIKQSGWILLVHPDFLWNTPLAKEIKKFDYFSYSANEALLLTEKEEAIIISVMQNIKTECFGNADKFSQDIIISMIRLICIFRSPIGKLGDCARRDDF